MAGSNAYLSFSAKTIAVSTVVLSTAVMLHAAGPSIIRFASSEVPKIYGSVISWLTPPYLYFVINGIIISIAASSRFQKAGSGSDDAIGSGSGSETAPVTKQQQEFIVVAPPATVVEDRGMKVEYVVSAVEEVVKVEYSEPAEYQTSGERSKEAAEEEYKISRSSWTPKRRETVTETVAEMEKENEIPTEYSSLTEKRTEKPLVSARLGRRKSLKASPEAGKALGVARPKKNDTLESTWRAITDGRSVPLTRHLKKSDTWETQNTRAARDEGSSPSPAPLMRKCETFNEHGGGARRPPTSGSPLGTSPAARLRKEPSLGQDDLNRRVEAFIKKFNEEMRLQRQESFKHYVDMINRGSH